MLGLLQVNKQLVRAADRGNMADVAHLVNALGADVTAQDEVQHFFRFVF